ncbi:MAG: nucleotidyltransferase domain-containing protein [Flavobacteriaceae bacterium]|nr:nucleotidyltransferase domain-containing protein [Flavobacteriaceae bacterium]
MNTFNNYKEQIITLCKTYRVKNLYVFGSVLTPNFNPKSDIDLIVEFNDFPLEEYADNYFDFKFSLQDILNRPIDLLEEKAIKNPYFRKNIEHKKQLVYGQ